MKQTEVKLSTTDNPNATVAIAHSYIHGFKSMGEFVADAKKQGFFVGSAEQDEMLNKAWEQAGPAPVEAKTAAPVKESGKKEA